MQYSKNYSKMIRLKMNINKGLICSVITDNTDKFKRDFEYMTGSKLKLIHKSGTENTYSASIINKR